MECVSTWPLLQRNKIDDSKINVAVQAIADAVTPECEATTADTSVKSEDTPKPQEVKTELLELLISESAEPDMDQPQPSIKPEDVEFADVPVPANSANGVAPMSVDETNFPSEHGRTSERLESQAMKLKRLATKVLAP
jgi:hypothetical protein